MLVKSSLRGAFSGLAIAACLIGVSLHTAQAQTGLPGFTFNWGSQGPDQLNYRLDYGGQANGWDRYRLRVPAKKMKLAVAQLAISYPDYYKGIFDEKNVEVRVRNKPVPLQEVSWKRDNNVIEILPVEPIPANSSMEIWLENVKNPSTSGMFYFNLQVQSSGDLPLYRYLGTWVISIT